MKKLKQYGMAMNAAIKARTAVSLAKQAKTAGPNTARRMAKQAKEAAGEAKKLAKAARKGR